MTTTKRNADFSTTGNYTVTIGEQTHTIFRDPENGWWYEDVSGKHFSQCVVGFNKKEAIQTLEDRVAGVPTSAPIAKRKSKTWARCANCGKAVWYCAKHGCNPKVEAVQPTITVAETVLATAPVPRWKLEEQKTAEAVASFPATFGLRAFPGDTFRASLSSSYMGFDQVVQVYTERLCEDGVWKSFAKGTAQELKLEVVKAPVPTIETAIDALDEAIAMLEAIAKGKNFDSLDYHKKLDVIKRARTVGGAA